MTTDERNPLLELSTLAPERPFIVIDDRKYEFNVPEDFGILEIAAMAREETELRSLEAIDDAEAQSPVVVNRIVELLDTGVRRALREPGEIVDKLRDHQKLAIVDAFTRSVRTTTTAPNRASRRTRSTTPSSSRRSARRSAPATG